jgi:transposase InsO family protein
VAHLYNLRAAAGYRARRPHWAKTRPTGIPIGERRAPQPDGHPGYLRIDSVHQGDEDGVKGVYHINVVDCVTQWEVVATCERLSEAYLLPVIKALLDNFPFAIRGFHADNGSEYINHRVARLLEKLRIEFTKSRPRHSNDNGLAETKNGAVVRKCFGYGHIPQRYAMQINAFCAASLNPYLNFHRPCLFAEDTIDATGKVKKSYPQRLVMTPLEKLASLPDLDTFFKARHHPRPTPGRGYPTDRQRRRPAAQRSPTAAVSIHPPPIQVRCLMTQLPTSSRLKPLLELTDTDVRPPRTCHGAATPSLRSSARGERS